MKEQIKIYEKIRSSGTKDTQKPNVSDSVKVVVKEEKGDIKMKKCYKCGSSDHLAKDYGETHFKCFKCKGSGHRAADCTVTKPEVKQEDSSVNMVGDQKESFESGLLYKTIQLKGFEIEGLVDTGCSMCTIRSDVYNMFQKDFQLVPERRRLRGAGEGVFYTQGFFEAPVVIDGIPLKLKFYVVRGEDIGYPAVLGTNLLQLVDLMIIDGVVRLVAKTSCNQICKNHIFQGHTNAAEVVGSSTNRVNIVQHEGTDSNAIMLESNENAVVGGVQKDLNDECVGKSSSSKVELSRSDKMLCNVGKSEVAKEGHDVVQRKIDYKSPSETMYKIKKFEAEVHTHYGVANKPRNRCYSVSDKVENRVVSKEVVPTILIHQGIIERHKGKNVDSYQRIREVGKEGNVGRPRKMSTVADYTRKKTPVLDWGLTVPTNYVIDFSGLNYAAS